MAEYNPSKIIKDGNTYNFRDTTKIPLAGSNEISGSLVPSTDGTVNLGSSTAQWNNAYIKSLTINGVACGDILTHNASEFVDVSSNQTIGGNKEFIDLQTIRFGTRYKGNKDAYILPEFSAGYSGLSITTLSFSQTLKIGNFVLDANNKPTLDTSKAYIQIATGANNNVNICLMEPRNSASSSLGTSANKWKTFNGINPGALSLPSVSSGINLDLTNFKIDGSDNKFRLTDFSNYPYDNGWLFVRLNGCTSYYLDHWYKVVSNSYTTPSEAIFFLPINDKDHDITLRCVCTSITYIKVFPCQGNV